MAYIYPLKCDTNAVVRGNGNRSHDIVDGIQTNNTNYDEHSCANEKKWAT